MIDLREKIKNYIDSQTETGHFSKLNDSSSVELIQQIFNNYGKDKALRQDFNNIPKQAELVFIVAPTGAGKDSLVKRFENKEKGKEYIELNMDMFRHYYPEFIDDFSELTDRSFADKTNEFSYEIYQTVQEMILTEFPGTNVIITGTLREKGWIEQTLKKYKANEYTDYKTKMVALSVPKKDSAFSIIKRYVSIVDSSLAVEKRDPSQAFTRGTARYTSLKYHDETFDKFVLNLKYFENLYESGNLVDAMEVHRRSVKETDFSEDTLVYSTENSGDSKKDIAGIISELQNEKSQITQEDLFDLFEMITKKENKQYFIEQSVLIEIIHDLSEIFERGAEFKKRISEVEGNITRR